MLDLMGMTIGGVFLGSGRTKAGNSIPSQSKEAISDHGDSETAKILSQGTQLAVPWNAARRATLSAITRLSFGSP
jgi:hypothetical protein